MGQTVSVIHSGLCRYRRCLRCGQATADLRGVSGAADHAAGNPQAPGRGHTAWRGNKEITALAPFREAALELQAQSIGSHSRWDGMWSVLPLTLPPLRLKRTLERQRMSSDGSGCHPFGRRGERVGWDKAQMRGAFGLWRQHSNASARQQLGCCSASSSSVPSEPVLGSRSSRSIRLPSVRALLSACEPKSTEQGYRDQLVAVAARTGWRPRISKPNYGRRCQEVVTIAWTRSWQLGLPPCRGNSGARSAMLSSRMTLSGYLCRLRSATWSKP